MTCGNEGPEKNTGRAIRQGHMARRNGTTCLSASISSSSHYQPTIGRMHNNHFVSSMANHLSFSFGTNMEATQTRQFALRLPMRLHSQQRSRATRAAEITASFGKSELIIK